MGALGSGCFEDDLEGGAGWEEEKENEATDTLASEAERALSIEEAVKALLQGLGEDHEREGLRRTPHRVAEAFRGGTRGLRSLYCRSAVTPLVLLFLFLCVFYDLSVLFRFFSLASIDTRFRYIWHRFPNILYLVSKVKFQDCCVVVIYQYASFTRIRSMLC